MIKKDIIPFHQIYDSVIKKNNIFSNISIYLKNNYFLKIKNLYSTIYIIEGKERYCKEPLSLLFYGDSQSVNYISQMFFKEKPEVEIIAICPFWKVNRIVMNLSRKVDLNIIKTYDFILEYFKKRGFFIIPAWVSLKIDVSRPFSEITKKFNKSAKRDVKKIKENGYTYEITTDIEKFKKFYYEIRKPYFSKRIGKKALYGSDKYNEIKIAFQNGKLFLIKKGNEYASGFVILTSDNGVSPHFRGTVQEGHMDQGAGSALNYFLIRWANEQGYKIINFGHTRTFLNDGILRFKRKWGMTINIDKFFTDIFGIKINNYSKWYHSFFNEHYVLF